MREHLCALFAPPTCCFHIPPPAQPPLFLSLSQVLLCNSKVGYSGPETTPLPGEPVLAANPYFDADEAEEGHRPAAVAYRYRRFAMPGDIKVVARTTLHGVLRKRGVPQLVSLCTLNEWDPKAAGTTEWRKTIDVQRGALLAMEIKNNAQRVAKYTMAALLAGADTLRLGFVSRVTRTDAENHVLLGVTAVQPAAFATQLALLPHNAWGVLRWLVETVRKHAKNLKVCGG